MSGVKRKIWPTSSRGGFGGISPLHKVRVDPSEPRCRKKRVRERELWRARRAVTQEK